MKIKILFFHFLLIVLFFQFGFASDSNAGKISLTLEQAINRALVLNRSIQSDLDNVLSAQFSLIVAESEFQFKFQPNLFTNLSGNNGLGGGLLVSKKFSFGTSLSINSNVQKSNGEFNSGIDILLSQPLLKGLSTNYNMLSVKQSEFSVRTAERSLTLTRMNVILQTVAAVYEIILRRKILGLQEASFKRIQGYCELAKIKEKQGFANALDVYRANIQLKQAETMLSNSQEQFQDATDNLKIILNIPMEQDIRVNASLTFKPLPIDETQAIQSALENRVELKQLDDMMAIMEMQEKAAKHNILPRVNLEVKYSTTDTNNRFWDSFNLNKGKVEARISSSGELSQTADRMNYKRSQMALRSVERTLSLSRDEIKREVKNALRTLIKLGKNIIIQKEQSHEARGKLELSKVKFSHDMADNFEIIESEAQYRQAEVDYISAVIDSIVGSYRLKAVIGTLLDDYGFKETNNKSK